MVSRYPARSCSAHTSFKSHGKHFRAAAVVFLYNTLSVMITKESEAYETMPPEANAAENLMS